MRSPELPRSSPAGRRAEDEEDDHDREHTPLKHLAERYWVESRRPLASLVFIAPLLVVYEAGVAWLGAQNGADAFMRWLLDLLGFGQHLLLPALTVCILLAWHYLSRQPWRLSGGVLSGMAAESLLLGVCLCLVCLAWGAGDARRRHRREDQAERGVNRGAAGGGHLRGTALPADPLVALGLGVAAGGIAPGRARSWRCWAAACCLLPPITSARTARSSCGPASCSALWRACSFRRCSSTAGSASPPAATPPMTCWCPCSMRIGACLDGGRGEGIPAEEAFQRLHTKDDNLSK